MDLKLPGYEREVVDGLRERGLDERSLVSTMYDESLERLGELAPGLRRGWSVPRVRRNYLRSPLALPAYAIVRVMRARLPAQAAARIESGGCEAIMAHQVLVSRRLVEAVHARGRRALRVDRRRRRPHPGARGARRRRRDHERSAAVQPLTLQGPVMWVAVRPPPNLISATPRS